MDGLFGNNSLSFLTNRMNLSSASLENKRSFPNSIAKKFQREESKFEKDLRTRRKSLSEEVINELRKRRRDSSGKEKKPKDL